MAGTLTIVTRKVQDPGALLSWLPAPQRALSWVRDGGGLAGWGEAAGLGAAMRLAR